MHAILENKKELAYLICNEVGCADYYPIVYQVAYEIMHKGSLSKKIQDQIQILQSSDVRALGYVPPSLFSQFKKLITLTRNANLIAFLKGETETLEL